MRGKFEGVGICSILRRGYDRAARCQLFGTSAPAPNERKDLSLLSFSFDPFSYIKSVL